MQYVSQAYQDSMKSTLRERGYIRVVFGYINDEVQSAATLDAESYYPDASGVLAGGRDSIVYADLEENFIKLDGSRLFAPLSRGVYGDWGEKALVSTNLISDSPFTFTITFSAAVSFNQITFNFGDNFPTSFTITDSSGNEYSYTDNRERICIITDSFTDITFLSMTVTSMRNSNSRFRLYSMTFGNGMEYGNDMILDSNLESSVSPITQVLPQMNFSVKIVNTDHYFDLDNPQSVLHHFDTSTVVNVYYGYQIPEGEIEWLQAARLYAVDWDSDYESVTIACSDILHVQDKEYVKGKVGRVSLYDLALDVLEEMGISDYTIDSRLASIYTENPLPRVRCSEALQIIANMACAKLMLKRDGGIQIGEPDLANYTLSNNGTILPSSFSGISDKSPKQSFATLEKNFTRLDGSAVFSPFNYSQITDGGYVSTGISKENKKFSEDSGADLGVIESLLNGHIITVPYTLQQDPGSVGGTNPTVTITFPNAVDTDGLKIMFDTVYPTKINVHTYLVDDPFDVQTVSNDRTDLLIYLTHTHVDKIKLEFISASNELNRVHIQSLEILEKTVYSFEGIDMMDHPAFTKFNTLKCIYVPYYTYELSGTEDKLSRQTINAEQGVTYRLYTTEPAGNYAVTVSSGTATIVDSGAYFVDLQFSETGELLVMLYGEKYQVTEREHVLEFHDKGSVARWENPLISDYDNAYKVSEWVGKYYQCEGTYEYGTRGNPEIDANDVVAQEDYRGTLKRARVTDITLGFNGAFSGSVKTLRGDEL